MKKLLLSCVVAALCSLGFLSTPVSAQVPQLVNYQGRVAVGTVNFDGSGSFKFALVNAAGTTTYWSNDGTSVAGSQPTAAVALTVTKGLYSVLLGDTSLGASMTAIPASIFSNPDVRLRVWFNDGTINGSQLLTPDQRLAPAAYLADGAVTSAKLAAGAVGTAQLAPGTVFSWQSVSGTSQLAQSNMGYTANDPARVTVTLPAAPAVGDTVRVLGAGAGGWSIAPSAGQSVLGGSAAGTSWTPHGPQKNWVALTSSATGSKLVAAASGEFLYTSADSGISWTARMTGVGRGWNGLASSSDGSKLVATVGGGQIYTSVDSGANWTARAFNASWTAVASSADGTRLAAASSGSYIYTSADSGASWTAQLGSGGHGWFALASSADGTKLSAAADTIQVFTSSNSGVAWTPHSVAANFNSLASSADGAKLVGTVNGGYIYTSTDSGATWTARLNDAVRGWTAVASSSDGNSLTAIISGGKIYTSSDAGANWAARDSNRQWQCVASSADGSSLAAGAYLNDYIYTSQQYLTGAQGSTAELQYIGNGQWQAANQSLIAAGAVGAAQITNGAVGSSQLAQGAVASTNIADLAVGSSQLAGQSVDTTKLADNAVTAAKIGANQVVKSLTKGLFTLTDAVTLIEGPNITIAPSGNTLTISASGTVSGTANVTHDASLIGNGGATALGVAVPLSLAGSTASTILTATNNGAGSALFGNSTSATITGNYGVIGFGVANGGVYGSSSTYIGVSGHSTSSAGVAGSSTSGRGVSGTTATANSTVAGVWGENSAGGGFGVVGNVTNINSTGVVGTATNINSAGVSGIADNTNGTGVYGHGTTYGAVGESAAGRGVYGKTAAANSTVAGVWGENSASGGFGVVGNVTNMNSTGVVGTATNINSAGVSGIADNTNGTGVYGHGTTYGAVGESTGGYGVYGSSVSGEAGHFQGNVAITGKQFFGSSERQILNLWGTEDGSYAGTQYGIGVQTGTLYSRTDGRFAWYQGGGHAQNGAGIRGLDPGTTLMTLDVLTPANGASPGSYGLLTVGALKINGADLAEPFEITTKNLPKGSVVIIDDENPGQLKLSDRAYDRRVAGILSGANGVRPGIFLSQQGFNEGGQDVALSGRVYVLADASDSPIHPGDMLTTSDTPGRAMKATDHARAQGAIIGKAMSTLEEGTGMVLVLVSLQ